MTGRVIKTKIYHLCSDCEEEIPKNALAARAGDKYMCQRCADAAGVIDPCDWVEDKTDYRPYRGATAKHGYGGARRNA